MALVKSLDDTLSLGDIFCLYSAESYGFIYAAQSSSVHNELAVGSRQDKIKPDIQDQHVISFECCVANRYKLNKKYRKLQQKLLSEPDNLQLRTSVAQAKIAADAENEDNGLEQVRQTGKKVVYGQIIQLKNVFTGKYIHVSTTKTSVTESNNMAVELHPINAKHCQFKIMPRYKVKSEGDVVQVDDQVVLESIKSPGSFLHVSKGVLGIASYYSKCFELNISVQQTGFTVIRKYKPALGDEEKIRLGDIIRFYHKEMEAYLVAEGLFDDILLEDVHLRMRPLDPAVPKTLNPSSSAITYWQIESQEGPTSGGLLKWEQQCRIIHMCTRKYLSVDTNGKVTLTSDHLDPRNVFRLHPVIREADDIPVDSYCRVEHVMTGHWLHSFTDEYKRKQEVVSEDTSSMSSLKYTKAELRQIGVIEVKQYDDAFTIQSVDMELVEIFNYMAGMVPFIQKIVKDKKDGHSLNAKNAHDTITALAEMRAFMIVDSIPCKDRQKLMRNLRIVELLVQLLQIPFRGSADQHHLTRIFVEAYDVLYTYLMGDSRKNELYIAKHIDFFLQQFEFKEGQIGLNAAHMVMELIKDNRKIVDRISHAHIDMFVDLLRRDKNHRYLDLLSVLCVCDGVSIADNQRYITEVWLMKGNRNCVFYTDLGQKIGKVHGVVYVSTTTGRTWKELSVFSQDSESEEYLFLEHQLELFGNLCKGQNDFSIKVITQELNYLTWEEGFFCLSDERLPDRLRAHYCDLIITMFVDIGDNHSVIDRVRLSFIYDGIDELDEQEHEEKKTPLGKITEPLVDKFKSLQNVKDHDLKDGDYVISPNSNYRSGHPEPNYTFDHLEPNYTYEHPESKFVSDHPEPNSLSEKNGFPSENSNITFPGPISIPDISVTNTDGTKNGYHTTTKNDDRADELIDNVTDGYPVKSKSRPLTAKFKSKSRPVTAKVKAKPDVVDMTYAGSVTHKIFPTLSDWISKFLAKNGDMTASQIGNNMLVKQVLRLVEYLVSFGYYYKPEDIKKLLEPLMSLLDGRNDKPYPNVMGKEGEEVLKHFRAVGRYQRSVETQAIVDAKCQALEVLDLFFNFIFNLRLEKFMYIFKVTHTAANKAGMFDNPELGVLLYETFQLEENPGISKPALRKLNQIFERTSYLKNYDLVAVLMDLSHYHYDEMIRKSMALLNRYYSAHNNLFSRAVQAQVLITDKSVDVSNKLEECLPKFRRYATAKLNQDQTTELCGILDKLVGMLHLEGEPEEEHGMNQSILYNFGVLEDSFKILSQEIDVKLLDQYQRQRKVLEKTFTLMKLMAHNNKIVQGRLFDRLDMLLGKQGAGPELADALTEVFTGNSNTCMKISGYQIQKIMTLVAKNKEAVPQFLDLLNAIVKVEELDLPLKRNQGFVMQYFMQFRSDVAFVIDQPEADREAVLTNPSHKDLQYFISMVDMLATCAEGENRFIESICQTIFKIPELLKILNNPGINSNLKRPFLRFFLWVYLNTAGGMIESGAGDLPHEQGMWDYLASLQGTINNVIAFATAQPRVTELLLKRPPSKKEEDLKKIRSDQGQAQEEVIRGSLHYLFDGVMPFIMVFCRTYYQPDTSMFPNEPENIDNLTKTFKAFIQVMAPLISIEKQMKNLVACMTTLLSASTLPVREMEEFQEKYGRGVTAQDVRSAARREYDEYYAAELEINAQLNVFAVNMKVAYGGLNTVQAQIGYDSDAPYSELGGDEELPLGQEFQEHLKCFIDNTKKLPKDKYKLAEKLVKQMQISQNLTNLDEKEKLEQLDLDVKCLQLLRGLIYNEMVKLPEDWESESSKYVRQLKVIEKTQKALDDQGVVIGVLDHLARPQDQVVREVLAFMSALLFNGNDQVQASLIKYFTGTREETFFFSIKSRMQMSALATREKRLLNAMHQAKIEEALQQAKALQKAMKSGKVQQDQLQQANQLGSMLSMAKRSMLNLQGGASGRLKGSRLSLGKRTPSGSAMGSRMMLKSSNAHPVSNGFSGKASMLSKTSLNTNGKVGPQPPEIQIEHVADEELAELMQTAVGGEEELEFKDDGYIELVLRILGLMCDNQHHDLQDYLREQPDNIKSVNLVAETTRFLSILYSNITTQSMPLICQLFDTLVEFTSGNQQNQAVVFDNKICDYMNHILRVGAFKGCSKKEIYELKKSIGTLIRSLSEENPPEEESEEDTVTTLSKLDQEIMDRAKPPCLNDPDQPTHRRFEFKVNLNLPSKKEVMEYMDEDTLMNTLTDAYLEIMRNDPDHQELMDLYSEVGFTYFHILCRKNDLDYMVTKESMIKKPEHQAAWDFFAANTMSIEIVKNNELQKLYFRVKDTKVLRDEIKDKFKYEVDRTTPSNKLRSFMDWSSDIIQDIKYQRKVYANPIGRLLVKLWLPMNYSVLFLSVVMSVLMMVFWVDPKTDTGDSDVDSRIPVYTWDGYPYLLYSIGGLHNLLSFLVLVTFLISNKPTFPPIRRFRRWLKKDDDEEDDFRAWHEKKLESHLEIPIYSVKTIYYMTFLACSILGTIFYGYFFAFHLLHIAQLNQLLKRVIQAVTTNGMSLLLVALLGLGIFYIYALIAFAFLREDFLQEAAGRHCRTVGQCLLTMVHHGFVDTPYTSTEGQMTVDYDKTVRVSVINITHFILVTTIGLNIIFGIIVDTFSQLRDSKWEIDKDMQNNCFICSRESYDFERQGAGFEKHVKEEHYQWAYLFFFIHLDETRPNDYTALELFVFNLLDRNRFDFFPLNRALSLTNEEDSSERKIDDLRVKVDYIVNKLKEEEAAKERERERQRQLEWAAKHKKGSA